MSRSETVDVAKLIDTRHPGALQWRVFVLAALLLLAGGFNLQAMLATAPAVADSWHLPPEALAPVFGARLTGLIFGTAIFGLLADRFGRKIVLLATTTLLAAMSLLTPLPDSPAGLAMVRFIAGLGLGGMLTSATALATEFSPRRAQPLVIATVLCSFAAGIALGQPATLRLSTLFGWSAPFSLDGFVLLLLVPLAGAAISESPRFLVARGSHQEDVAAILRKLAPELMLHRYSWFIVDEHRRSISSPQHLFGGGRGRATASLGIASAMNALALSALIRWVQAEPLALSPTLAVGGMSGALVFAFLAARIEAARLLAIGFVAATTFLAALALGAGPIFGFGAGFCIIGGEIGLVGLAATRYSTPARATAVAWTIGAGCLAAVIAPRMAGIFPPSGASGPTLLFAAILPVLLAAASIRSLRRLPAGRSEEEALGTGAAQG